MARNVTTGAGQQPEDGALPTGTVTFLFTDIAGSTRLLREDRREYAAALADHRTVVRAAVAAHGGREVDTQGDSFMVAFPAATEAVAAAAEAQLSLAAHPWPESARVLVRMGLHSGEATLAGGGYVGLAVHRAARIAAAAAGGQVLLSEATAALVGDEPPSGTAVRSLGRHALKDFPEPAGLYQLDVEGLPTSFPAPATLSQHRRRPLPVPVGEVLGRDDDLAVLEALLTDPGTRLVTVTGPGGVGKTRLALEAARAVAAAFPDGVVFVPLSALTDPSLVLPTVADAVGARRDPGVAALDALRAALGEDRLLLVLDNFEQVVAAAGDVAALLEAVPAVVVLVTSRQALRVRPERLHPVAPLAATPAERLFAERAAAVHPGFTLDAGNAAVVAEICRRLDGLPLSIELAAARIRLLPAPALLARLAERLDVIGDGPVDLPERQRTLRATMEWSSGLLGRHEQAVFTRLGVFSGGWTLDAAEAVCGRAGEPAVIDAVAALLDASLLVAADGSASEPRWSMLATVRSHALEKLLASADRAETERRHSQWLLALSDSFWHTGALGFPAALARFDHERADLRAAVHRAVAAGDGQTGVVLARNSLPYLVRRDGVGEFAAWLDGLLRSADELPPAVRGRVLVTRAMAAGFLGDLSTVRPLLEEGRRLLTVDVDDPEHHYDRAGAGLAGVYAALADGSVEEASRCIDEVEAGFAAAGQEVGLMVAALIRGNLALLLRDHHGAETSYRAALEMAIRLEESSAAGEVLSLLGLVLLGRGDVSGGRRTILDGAAANRRNGTPANMVHGLVGLAAVALEDGRPAAAARALGAVDRARQDTTPPLWPVLGTLTEELTARTRQQLGVEGHEAASAEGRGWSLVQALDRTLAETAAAGGSRSDGAPAAMDPGGADDVVAR